MWLLVLEGCQVRHDGTAGRSGALTWYAVAGRCCVLANSDAIARLRASRQFRVRMTLTASIISQSNKNLPTRLLDRSMVSQSPAPATIQHQHDENIR